VCRPNGPKYWEGYLVWFPQDDAYRAIGHRCGLKFFGASFGDQVEELEKRKGDERAVNYLLDNLPTVSRFRLLAEGLLLRNGELDRNRSDLVKVMGRSLVQRLVKEGSEGRLSITDDMLVPSAGADGRATEKRQTVVVAEYPISELDFIRDQRLGVSWAINSLTALRGLPETDNEIQEDLLAWSQTLGACSEARLRLEYAFAELVRAVEFCRRAVTFFSEPNFASLQAWTMDPRCPIELRAGIDTAGRLTVSVPGGKIFRLEMRPSLTDPIPILPEIIARRYGP
jgi:hypothetical protein